MSQDAKTAISARNAESAANFRMLWVSVLAAFIGIAAGFIAFILYNLIGLITNLSFFQRISFRFASPWQSQVGAWVAGAARRTTSPAQRPSRSRNANDCGKRVSGLA